MRRLAVVALASIVLVAACGGDEDIVVRPPTGASGGSAGGDVEYPAEASTPVVVVQSFSFWVSEPERWSRLPILTIYGDGLVIAYAGTDSDDAPPMLPALSVRRLDPDGMQLVLSRLRDAGLLGPLDLSSAANEIYDSVTTSVTVRADGGLFRHDGYHLSSDPQYRTPERDRFLAVLDDLADLDALVGAEHLADAAGAFPDHYLLRARELDRIQAGQLADTQPWPLASVMLATAGDCKMLDADEVGDAFDGVALATRFRTDDRIFEVAIRPFTSGLTPAELGSLR